jgi:hypothetical protein
VADLQEKYPNQIHLHIIDAISVEGITKSRQFGVNYHPVVIINHQSLYTLSMLDEASEVIDEILSPQHQKVNVIK